VKTWCLAATVRRVVTLNRRPAGRLRQRRVLKVALPLLVTPFPVWALARVLGLERGMPAVQLMAFTPYVAAAAVPVAAVALATRRWVAGAAATIASIALVAVVAPRALADGSPLPAGRTLRVVSANMLAGAGDERAIVDLVQRLNADVLALQEFTPGLKQRLEDAGIAELLPYAAAYPQPGVEGSGLYSRHPLRDPGVRVHRGGFTQAHATVLVPGGPAVEFESVHPMAPAGPGLMRNWKDNLTDQPSATPDGPIHVLAGDFNATLDHAALRRLIDTCYRDAASVVGAGLHATWPYDEKWFIPGVTLDRVLADKRVGVRAAGPYRVPGSDHKAFYAELVLPPA
jgi:endonuclease/exonuclease/phosphatase (EEP) superfamily protein YafD